MPLTAYTGADGECSGTIHAKPEVVMAQLRKQPWLRQISANRFAISMREPGVSIFGRRLEIEGQEITGYVHLSPRLRGHWTGVDVETSLDTHIEGFLTYVVHRSFMKQLAAEIFNGLQASVRDARLAERAIS